MTAHRVMRSVKSMHVVSVWKNDVGQAYEPTSSSGLANGALDLSVVVVTVVVVTSKLAKSAALICKHIFTCLLIFSIKHSVVNFG